MSLNEILPIFDDKYDGVKMRRMVDIINRAFASIQYPARRVIRASSAGPFEVPGNAGVICVDYTATAAITLNIPPARRFMGRSLTIFDSGGNAGANNITVNPSGSELIAGAGTYTISTNGKSIIIASDGDEWFIEGMN
ncbi:MAG: hypothetical protein ACXWYM_00255 [Candidatus Binatia bacterium]